MYNILVTKPLNIYHQKYFVISFRGSFDTFLIFHVKVLEKLDCKISIQLKTLNCIGCYGNVVEI